MRPLPNGFGKSLPVAYRRIVALVPRRAEFLPVPTYDFLNATHILSRVRAEAYQREDCDGITIQFQFLKARYIFEPPRLLKFAPEVFVAGFMRHRALQLRFVEQL